MRISSLFPRLGSWALLIALSGSAAMAQTFSAAAPKRHYTAQGKTYFRGPKYFTIGAGVSYYHGDLTSRIGDNFISPAVNVGLSYRMTPHFVLGGELGFVQLSARGFATNNIDGTPRDAPYALSFVNPMFTATGIARYHLIADRSAFAGGVGGPPKVMPFLQVGLGFALIDPQTYAGSKLTNREVNIQPLERNDYSAFIGIFPVGTGLTFTLSKEVQLSLEANYYLTFSDSLDDVEQRGDSDTNDGFGTMMAKVGFAF